MFRKVRAVRTLIIRNPISPTGAVCIRHKNSLATAKVEYKPKVNEASKPLRSPFIKNIFVGKFDETLLTFPQLKDIEDVQNLEKLVLPLEQYMKDVDSREIEVSTPFSEKTLEDLKKAGAFGLLIPKIYGGCGLSSFEYARFAELLYLDGSIGVLLTANQIFGTMGIVMTGTEEQKQKYLPRFASGEWIGAFCLSEEKCGSDPSYVQTEAVLSEDGKTWNITGKKTWISNGDRADLFTVFARTEVHEFGGLKSSKLTAFLVEKTFPGISISKATSVAGTYGATFCEISFNDTPVPVENVLGEVGHGFKLCVDILGCARFSTGSSYAGILKRVLNQTTRIALSREVFGKELKEFEMVKKKIADTLNSIYAMDSMSYLTAGILDGTENPDVIVESAIVKVYSSEKLLKGLSDCCSIIGSASLLKDNPYDRIVRDSHVLSLLQGSDDVLRMFIALNGLHHAGIILKEEIEKVRNPLMYPRYIFKKVLKMSNFTKMPKLKLGLEGYVHPSLRAAANQLEYSVYNLQLAVEVLFSHHGESIINNQIELNKLTDIAMLIYEMTAVISRASRSYCIGLRNAELEILMASTIAFDSYQRIIQKLKEIQSGLFHTRESNLTLIAKEAFHQKGYCLEHPLTRTF